MTNAVEVYTDGACAGNPGPGGWGVIVRDGDQEREYSGFEPLTTNNRMELMAAIAGLEAAPEGAGVVLYSDSEYLTRAFRAGWLERWRRNGWQTADRQPVANQDLWRRLLDAAARRRVEWRWVRGHAENAYNNRCDALARAAIEAGTRVGDDAIPFRRHLGIVVERVQDGEAHLSMRFRPELGNRWGGVHGGAVSALIDAAISTAIRDRAGPGAGGVTIDLTVHYLAPGRGDLRAVGRLIRHGPRLAVGTGDVYDASGERIAFGVGTYAIRPQQAPGAAE